MFPEIQRIISIIDADERQDIVILIIPSHDKNDKPLRDQEIWAGSAMDLFADLYRAPRLSRRFKVSIRITKVRSITTNRFLSSPMSSGKIGG